MKIEQILQNLISVESISGNEGAIQKYIYKFILNTGLKPFCVGKNIVLKVKGCDSSKCLVFNSHVDTVSVGDMSKWQHDPFDGVVKKGKIYGLGSSDEKSFAAVMLKLIELFAVKKPQIDLIFMFVVDEEVDGGGTMETLGSIHKSYLLKYKEVSAILGEPTNLDVIEIGHKGNFFFKVELKGDTGHGSQPQKIKKHAINEIFKIIKAFEVESKCWKDKYKNKYLGSPTISLTAILGGNLETPNKFADKATAVFDVRTTPEIHEIAFEKITNIAKKVDKDANISFIYPPANYGFTDEDQRIVKVFKKVTNAKIGFSFSSNDMCFFTKYNIPAVVYGPGKPEVMHKQNEYCDVQKLYSCIDICQQIIGEF